MGGGCQVNAFNVDSNMMCPEDRCTINTNKPFVISHFQNAGQANTWMGQEGRDASLGCAMMADISPTWRHLMAAWCSLLLSGVAAVLTWAGWTVSLAVAENVILMGLASPSPTLNSGHEKLF